MKPKIIKLFACIIVLLFLIRDRGMAQQQQLSNPALPLPEQASNAAGADNYTYTLFVAPNKMYGYNIFKNGRIIFHQPAMAQPAGNKEPSLTIQQQADKAATIAIQKLRKGMPAELSHEELMQAAAK